MTGVHPPGNRNAGRRPAFTRDLLEPTLGFEPRTCCLRNSCSTAELCRRSARIADAPLRRHRSSRPSCRQRQSERRQATIAGHADAPAGPLDELLDDRQRSYSCLFDFRPQQTNMVPCPYLIIGFPRRVSKITNSFVVSLRPGHLRSTLYGT